MSSKVLRRLLVVALASAVPASAVMVTASTQALAQAGEDIDLEVFYRELQPHGEWFRHERWGEVWRPNVDQSWRPYTHGHWAWTEDHGWMWVAEEEWGWAVFHYGRWIFDDEEDAWIWIPGSQWAPAWVQWRESEDQIGWAPLPPESYLDDGVMRFDPSYYDSPRFSRYWVFVPPRYLFEPGLYRHVSPISRQSYFFRSTRPVTVHHHMYRGNIYHPGPDWRRVERWAGRPVPLVTLRTVTAPRDQGWRRLGPNPSVLPIYRPRVSVAPDRTRASLPNVGPRPERDWRRGDARPDQRPDQRPSSVGRPSTPDARPPSGGWNPAGRPPSNPSPGPGFQRPPAPERAPSGGWTPAERQRSNPPVEPQRPINQGRPSPRIETPTGQNAGAAPTPWSPPNRSQQQQPAAGRPSGPPQPPTGQPPRPPQQERERPSNDR